MKTVRKYEEMPIADHWHIIEYGELVEYSGWESGPGYSTTSSTTPVVYYRAFDDKKEWEDQVKRLALNNSKFSAGFVKAAQINKEVTVRVVG